MTNSPRHPCGIGCTGSEKPLQACECECGGANHGLLHRPVAERPQTSWSQRSQRHGGAFAALAAAGGMAAPDFEF